MDAKVIALDSDAIMNQEMTDFMQTILVFQIQRLTHLVGHLCEKNKHLGQEVMEAKDETIKILKKCSLQINMHQQKQLTLLQESIHLADQLRQAKAEIGHLKIELADTKSKAGTPKRKVSPWVMSCWGLLAGAAVIGLSLFSSRNNNPSVGKTNLKVNSFGAP